MTCETTLPPRAAEAAAAPRRSHVHYLRRSLAYLRPHGGRIAVVLALTLVASGLPTLEPLAQGAFFDRITRHAPGGIDVRALLSPVLILIGLVAARQLAEGASALLAWRVRLRVNRELLADATARLHTLPLAYHQGRGVGDTMTRVDRGINSFVEGLSSVAFQMIPALVYVIISFAIMVHLCPLLALVAAGFVVPPLIASGSTTAEIVSRERAVLERWCGIWNRLQQVLTGIKTVKAFARETEEHARFVDSVASAQQDVLSGVHLSTRLSVGKNFCANAGRVAVLGVGGVLVARGVIGVGTLVAFISYVGGLYGPAHALLGLYETTRRAELGLETIFGVLDAEDSVPDPENAVTPEALRGDITFDRVTFDYDRSTSRAPALSDVSFHIRAGDLVAVVGPSGAGKSTLADLMLRLHDPTAGAVLLDGHDLRRLSQQALRRAIGIVTQEPFLFEDTLAANIRYGSPDATPADVRAAARAAQCEPFVDRLRAGYETRVGRGGVHLSGGERQRIAIARTILKDPSLVILDEPTSSLDVESEAAVHLALGRLARGRTTVLIAHRLASTARADQVLVLKAGRVVQAGPPAELLAAEGPYRQMMRLSQATSMERPPAPASDGEPRDRLRSRVSVVVNGTS